MSPNARTRRALQRAGAMALPTEQWITTGPGKGFRRDAFGFADMIAFWPDGTVTFVQATVASQRAARRKKIEANDYARRLWGWGYRIELWSWAVRKRIYQPTVEWLNEQGLMVEIEPPTRRRA